MVQTARRFIEIEVDAAQALRVLGGIETATKGTERAVTALQRQMAAMGDAFRGFIGFLGTQQLVAFADAATDIQQRLLAVTGTVAASGEVFEDLFAIANRLGVGIQELADSFAKLQVALPDRSAREVTAALEAVSTILATTGASTQQVNAVLLQFNQALASGVLQGDELRSVYENAPVLLKAWQEAADFTSRSIKELSASGAFTTESFFELLPVIRQTSVELIGMEQPAITISRAFEILKNNIIELFKESQAVSVVMAALAGAIVLVADNLDLLIAAGAAFIALKLPSYLASLAVSAGLVASGVQGITAAQIALTAGTGIWVSLVGWLTGAAQGAAAMTASMTALRAALNTVVGQFIALFAVFQAWDWAIDRLNEAAQATDRLVERVSAARDETQTFVDEILKIQALDLDVTSVQEMQEGLSFAGRSAREFRLQIREMEDELEGLTNAAERVSVETRLFDPEAAARADFLIQQLANLRRKLLAAEIASEDLAQGLRRLQAEAEGTLPTFDELMRELDAFSQAGGRVATQRLRVEAQLELTGLQGLDLVRAQIAQSFEAPIRKAEQAIADANARLERLTEVARFTEAGKKEFEALTAEIQRQTEVIKENEQAILAVQAVRAQEEESLVQQAQALREAEATVDALDLIRTGFEESIEVQFALQELYAEGAISADELTRALGALGEATSAPGLEQAHRQQQALAQSLKEAEQAAQLAAARVREYAEGGDQAVEAFDAAARVQQAFSGALRDQGTTLETATESQLQYAEAVADVQKRLEVTQRTGRTVENVRELTRSLHEALEAAQDAQGALQAFNAEGETGLTVFQRQRRLQESFTEVLRSQGVTYRTASQEQLTFARAITQALRDQLDAQDRLNRAQRQSQAILEAQARIGNIGVTATAEIQDFGDISDLVDDITSEAVRGNRSAAEELFNIAEENLRRLARDVSGGFAERSLERAKRELQRAAELVFQEPALPPQASVLDAEIAASTQLAIPTLSVPIVFDDEAVDTAVEGMRARLAREVFTVQVEPEIVGLAVDDVLSETVVREGATPA